MHFDLTEEQSLIAETARKLAADRLAPLAETLDHGGGREAFLENLKALAENGFMGLNVRADYGGAEAGTLAFALSVEALGQACASTGVTVSVTNMLGEVIQAVGNEAQRAAYLPRLTDGTYAAGGFCLTEAGAGSDPAGMKTRAVKDGDSYILNGAKLYITSAEYAGVFVVWAVTDPAAPKGKGISCFLVEAGTPGLIIGKAERKMGQTGSATNEVLFQDCRVPASALMGQENQGFRVAVGELAGGRIGIAALSLGIARAAMSAAKAYVKERQQFGAPLSDMQGIQWMIADRETELEAARLLILQAAWLKDQGRPFAREASMAKLFASEASQKATYTALQLHGGAGYIKDYPLERYARDARITTIYEGTSEIQRLIIARETLKGI
ncbi:acyl-CoA dehydrogenase family protein [Pannonibacter indicus]|uniref:3-sulfinopropanoyl-CoA desulfinase n=1 Tax=Pannonibacter indicus TaxID=466044 RepID=A0A0K6HU99_9HYPH|nr:acyl-CoA dehydrogenase family protein [Pannonibacter indicus]CUA94577.1 Acyl-CoA dehydrogenase related to the alkylation response protein AidB [Pannonibacter indicus]